MSEVGRLQREIQVLRADLLALAARLERLEGDLADLQSEARPGSSVPGILGSPPRTAPKAYPAPKAALASDYSQEQRERAARLTGQFFHRCLNGEARGESGRGLIRLPNRVYVVIRTFEDEFFLNPVRVYSVFAPVRNLVSEPGNPHNFGSSIFAGFASQWEARIAVREADLDWPTEILDQ